MKKVIILLLIIGGALTFTSCNKDVKCTTKRTTSGVTVTTDVTVYKKLTREEKKDIINFGTYTEYDDDGTTIEYTSETTCE